MKGFGFGFSITRPAAGGGARPVAPILSLTSPSTDDTPEFSLLATNPQGGDTFELQVSDNIGFTGTPDTVDVGFVSGNPIAIATTTHLANGVYYARADMVHNGVASPWSNVVTFTIAVTLGQPIGLLLALTKAA